MQKYKSNIITTSGAAVRNVPVTVLKEDGTLASLFLDRDGNVAAPNPLKTGADGTFYFYAVNGRYGLHTTVDGVSVVDSDAVLLMDPEELTVAGPIATAVAAAEASALRAENAVATSGITDLVADVQNALIDANNAKTQAISSASSADMSSTAAAASAASASTSAAQAEISRIDASKLNLGDKAEEPATDNQGQPLRVGATYYDTVLGKWRVWTGTRWGDGINAIAGVSSLNGRTGAVTITKADVGLSNVDNTSDADKPISNATQQALNGKANTTHTHAVADVSGLQSALDGKAAAYHGHTIADTSGLQAALDGKAAASHTHNYLPLTGGMLSGALEFNASGSGNGMAPGNGDACTDKVNNLKVTSWFGIGFGPSVSGNPVPNGEYSHWFNMRDGSTGMRGSLTVWGNVTSFSDIRLKTDLTKIEGALEKVCAINGYTYARKDTGERQTGVVAQEVQKVLPEAVVDNGDRLSVAYGNMVGLLIEAIKELKSEVDQLKGK